MKKPIGVLFLFVVTLCAVLPTLAAAPVTQEYKLENGMKIIVREDHRAPVVVVQVWYLVGGIDESNGTSGVAHVLEHMMFKGTKEVLPGQFSKIIAANGGKDNAFTNRDYTTYFAQLRNDKLELALKLEADRMTNLTFSDEDFWKEIKVVMEERRLRTEDNAHSIVYEQLVANAYNAHPYGRPVIGFMNDLENMKPADAREWYKRWYSPNNATLVVVGDVNHQEVLALADKYFGPLKPQALPERKPQTEPPQLGVKRITVKAQAELPYIAMAYHAPVLKDAAKDWEPYALQLLMGVLDGNESARLNKTLVRDSRIASSAGAGYDAVERGPGMIVVDGTPSEGKTVAELEIALRAQLEKVKAEGVTEDELQRVKSQIIAGQVFGLDSMFGQAMQIGRTENAGFSWRDLDVMLERLRAVTADQVKQVAQKYLQDDRLTVAILDPQPVEKVPPRPAPEGLRHSQ
ncbi:MAG: insulinase family protein [Pseudomonadota bacterium]|nr:insulinase family protein [Pseudomonadota bacterium]